MKSGDYMKLLIVEDNTIIASGLKYFFETEKYEVFITNNVHDTYAFFDDNLVDLVILDISLPDGDGFSLAMRLKELYHIPIIFLTAKDEESDIVHGLDLAEDYLTKPFRNRELLARVNKVLRNNTKDGEINIKGISINRSTKTLLRGDEAINLTALEYKIFDILLEHRGNIVSQEFLLDFIYERTGNYVNDNTLRVYIKRIREKLGDPDIIVTVKGLGYKVE